MKLRNLFVGAVAAVFALAGCQEKEQNLGTPDISISTNELTFDVEGGEQAITVNATRDWKVETDADWVVVDPAKGEASADDQTVTVTVLENTGMDRSADLKFTIGMKSKYLTVSQAGPGGSAEALIVYYNDYDKVEAEKTYGSGSSWPYLDQFDGWMNQTGTGAANVEYAYSGMSARANSTSDSSYSDYAGSGKNNMFFGKSAYLATKNIALGGATDFTLTFGSEKYSQDGDSVFKNAEFHVYLSNDAAKWVEIDYTFAGTEGGRWNIAAADFSVPAGTENLSVCVKADVASVYRMDDLKLVISDGGAEVDFSKGVEMDFTAGGSTGGGSTTAPESKGKMTVEEFIAAADTQNYYELTGTVSGFNPTYCSFDLTDATGKIYVYSVLDASKAEWTSKISNGGTITIYGKYLYYEQKSQHEVVDAHIVSFEGDGSGSTTPSGQPESLTKATIAEFLAAPESSDVWYELTGEIVSIETGNAYGNFTIKDATGEVYIYGMTSKWVGSNDKSFASLGLKETDVVTLGTLRGSYNGQAQGGGSVVPAYYISHVPGAGLPEDPSGTVELTFSADTQESAGSYTSDWSATIGTNSWRIVNFNNNNNKWSYIKCGHKATSNTATITTKNALAGTITSVVVQVDKIIDASKCTTKLEVASDASFSNIEETVNVTIAQGAVNYTLTTPRANCYYRLVFDCVGLGGDNNGNVQISKVKYLAAE
ncbi:MAG: BACON domain-containing protein [Bacteroidales bacterium]|nr:BACON domain-containing protein [Bacteroidales bacterium]